MKSKSSLPPGLNQDDVPAKPKEDTTALSKAAKKNLKRKEKKKQQSQEHSNSSDQLANSLAKTSLKSDQSNSVNKSEGQGEPNETDKGSIEKKIRNLRKKLKQIEDLEAKISSGELKEPQKEQLEKISKKAALLEEMKDLELELVD